MPPAGKQSKFKLETVRIQDVKAPFLPSLRSSGGTYLNKISELAADPGAALQIFSSDVSTLMQLRKAAVKLKVRLLFARRDNFTFIRAFRLTEKQVTILNFLDQNPATVNGLRQIPDCNVVEECRTLAEAELIKLDRDSKWHITDAGRNDLIALKTKQE